MKYAKLVNGSLRVSPKNVEHSGKIICNPKEDILLALGYLPVCYTNMPDDAPTGQHYESHWEQTDTEILQSWTLADDPVIPEPELSAEEALDIIMGVAE